MINSIAASRRLAARMLAWQIALVLVAALLFLLQGRRAALATALGGMLVVLGTALLSAQLFGGRQRIGAGMALIDLLVGMALKWLVFIVGLYVLLALWRMPGIAVLVGMGAAMVVNLFALRFKDQA
ncbi:MAG: ATP synthase subunit I [Rhodanobacter sp.]